MVRLERNDYRLIEKPLTWEQSGKLVKTFMKCQLQCLVVSVESLVSAKK